MDADRRNDTGIFRYIDVEYTPEGHTDAYRWDDFLGIAGGHVYSAMDTIDMVSTGGQYEGDEPEHAYACEIVGCCGLSDGVALFRPVSHDGADLIQIAFLRNDVDDATGAYTERFEAGSFDLPAADLPRSEFGVDLLEYFSGRSFKYTPGVSRELDPQYELDRWAAVVCNGFTAVNVMSSGNVEELGWDYTEMELDPTGTCGLFDGMLLDWDDDTPAERRDHEAYFPDAFTVGARILADDWDHELGNNEVRSRCFAIIEDADQFTDHDTARDWLCESTMADFSEVEARTFFQNLTLMDSEEIAKLDGRPIIPSAGADECRAAMLAFNERMVPRRRELGLGDTAVVGKTKKSETTSKVVPMKKEQAVHGLGRVDFSGLGYGWGTGYPDSLSVDAIGIDFPSGEHNIILNFSPITHAPDVDGRKLFCHETTIGYDLNADSWSGATIGPDFWTLDGKEAREFAENIGLDRLAARACVRLGIEAPGLKGREALPIPKATDVVPEPSVQAEAAKNAVTEVTVIPAWVSFPDEPGTAQYRLFCEQDTEPLDIDEQIFFSGYTAEELCGMVGKTVNGDFTIVGVEEPKKMKATYVRPVQKAYNPADMAAAAKKTAAAKLSGDGSGGGKRI